MDGKQKQYYVKANSEYKIELVSALSDNGAGDVIEMFAPFYEKDPSLSGKPVSFTAVGFDIILLLFAIHQIDTVIGYQK